MNRITRKSLWCFPTVLLAVASVMAREPVTFFPLPSAASRPYTIVAGPDGNLWFTESDGNRIGRISPEGEVAEFPLATPGSGPYGIAVGPDAALWFTERFANRIGRITLGGAISEFDLPTDFAQPWEIALGPDGHLWFTEEEANQLGRISLDGLILEFPTGTCCFPTGITAGADGNIWFTVEIGDRIGRMTPEGTVTSFPIGRIQVLPWDIAPGPDGNVWFTELVGRSIGHVAPDGTIKEFRVPGGFSGVTGIATGPDGRLWYTENDAGRLGRMTTDGQPVGARIGVGGRPLSIALGPDGNLWFVQADANAIGRVNVARSGIAHVLSMDVAFVPAERVASLGDRVRWIFLGPRVHAVADASGLALFDSGPHAVVTDFTVRLTAAGTYPYEDAVAGLAGSIAVPVDLPATGSVGVPFAVTWATGPLPAPLVADVEVKTPGSDGFEPWWTGAEPGADFVPAQPGAHEFRARLRDETTGAAVGYSPPQAVVVE